LAPLAGDANLFRASQLLVARQSLDRITERSGVKRRDCHRTIALEALFASELESNRRITTHFDNATMESEQFLGRYQDFFLIKQPDRQVRPPQYRMQRKPELVEPSR
jgi:hypothetical protein